MKPVSRLCAILSLVLVLCTLALMLMINRAQEQIIAALRMPLGESQAREVAYKLQAEWERHEKFLEQDLKYSVEQCREAKRDWLQLRMCEALLRLERR